MAFAPAAAMAGASIVGSVLGGKGQKKAAKQAAQAQQNVAAQNNALRLDLYNRDTANFQPTMDSGAAARESINSLLRGDQTGWDAFRNSTNYDFQYGQGMNALNQGLASQGARHSGAAQKAAIRYGQNFAGNALGGYTGLLQGQQNLGVGAAQALAGVSSNYGNAVSSNNQNAADAASNAALLRGQANSQMYGGVANALGNFGSSFGSGFKGF